MQPIVTIMVLGFSVLMPLQEGNVPAPIVRNLQPGTSIFLSMSAANEYTILNIDENNSKLISFADNTGKDMQPDSPNDSAGFGHLVWLEIAGAFNKEFIGTFAIHTPKYASPDAVSIIVEAELAIKLSKGEKSAKAANVTLANKTVFVIDNIKFTVTKVNQTKDWNGNDCTEITLQYKKRLDALKKFTFKDSATGKDIKTDEAGSSSFSFNDNFTGELTFRLGGAQPIKAADIEMVSYAEIRSEKVQIKQTVNLAVQGKERKKMAVTLIEKPSIVTAAGQPPKTIEEFVGKVNSKTNDLSIARMKSPAGWNEPAQTPEFDEYTLVLSGELLVKTDSGEYTVKAGQAIIVPAGTRVTYSTPKNTEYIAVCKPAFSPDTVHRE